MADSDRFILVPYAGVNPNNATIYTIGIETTSSGGTMWKIASYIQNDSDTVNPVYCCNVNGTCYFIVSYANTYMRVKATNNSSNQNTPLSSRYDVSGTSISVYYSTISSDVFKPSNFNDLTSFSDFQSAALAFLALFPDDYVNISYVGNGCSIGGLSYVASGTGVVVPVTLPIGTTLSADNISVTKNGTAIDFNYNTTTQQIAFTAI